MFDVIMLYVLIYTIIIIKFQQLNWKLVLRVMRFSFLLNFPIMTIQLWLVEKKQLTCEWFYFKKDKTKTSLLAFYTVEKGKFLT